MYADDTQILASYHGRLTKCSYYAPVWPDGPWALDGKELSDNKYGKNPGYITFG